MVYRHADYLDQLRVQVNLVGFPMDDPKETWEFLVDRPAPPSLDDLLDELVDVIRGDQQTARPFIAHVDRTIRSWGASGAGATVVIDLAFGGIVGITGTVLRDRLRTAIGGAIDAAAKRLGRDEAAGLVRFPVDLDEAVARARWRVGVTYSLAGDSEALEVCEDERSEGLWRIALSAPDGTRYDVDLVESDNLVSVSRICRRKPETME